ncbi:HARB1 nuclease, partial [Polyodon spathula]|nr:HARB1 nuclease [Polyodon spathula]
RITLCDIKEGQIKHRYRLGSHIILELLSDLKDDSFQGTVAAIAGISQSAFSHALPVVLNACLWQTSKYPFFPKSNVYLQGLKTHFYDISGFPNLLGAIDCTCVPLTPPAHSEHLYKNGKQTYSINVQVVCNCAEFSTASLTNLNKN